MQRKSSQRMGQAVTNWAPTLEARATRLTRHVGRSWGWGGLCLAPSFIHPANEPLGSPYYVPAMEPAPQIRRLLLEGTARTATSPRSPPEPQFLNGKVGAVSPPSGLTKAWCRQ